MKVLKVITNDDNLFINDIISKIQIPFILEEYNISYLKNRRKAKEIMERHGTKKVPLIVFEDENLEECSAIWSESNPNWEEEIIKRLNDV